MTTQEYLLRLILENNKSILTDTELRSAPVEIMDYHLAVALGLNPDTSDWDKWGFRNGLAAGVEEVLASWGGAFDPTTDIMTAAQTFTITYDNTTDGLGQTGAVSLMFFYVDENNEAQVASHVLGNTGSDVTVFTGIGINRCLVFSNGAGFNVNDITITATGDATIQAQIPAEASVTQQCIYHVPINKTFLADFLFLNALKIAGGGTAPQIIFKAYSWSRVTNTRYDVFTAKIDTDVENHIELTPKKPFKITGREVFYLTAKADKVGTDVNGRFSGLQQPT